MSLRARLLVGMAVVGVVLVVAAIVVTRTTESYLVDRVDQQLFAAQPVVRGGGFERGGPPGVGPRPGGNLNTLYVGVVNGDHVETITTPAFVDSGAPVPAIDASQALDEAGNPVRRPFTVGTSPPSSTRYRVLAFRDERTGTTFVGALSLADIDASVNRLVWLEVVATALIVGILGLVAFWVIRLGVRPLKEMTKTAVAIAGGDLSHRVPAGQAGTEAGDLGNALNAMLTEIEQALAVRAASEARLRQFIADASHELRTPVATVRGYAELYRRGGLAGEDALAQAIRRTEDEAVRMGVLIDDLLLLARLDQGRPLDLVPVDLGVLAVDAIADARARDPSRPITASVSEGIVVPGDEHRLRQVLANLVGNALVHTPAGTAIDVSVQGSDGRAVLEVSDSGPGMTPEVAARAFERFSRGDPSRSRDHGGSGLGLSIVQAIVEAHHGSVVLDSAPGRGTTVRVTLPRATS